MEKFEDKPLSFRMQWHIDYLQGPNTAIIRDTMRKALEVIKRYEDAPVGSLTVEGEHWVFYNGGEPGSVSRMLDKTIRLVEVLP